MRLASTPRAFTARASISPPTSHLLLRYTHLIEGCGASPCARDLINVTIGSDGVDCVLGFIDCSLRYGVSHKVRFKALVQLLSLGMCDTFLSKGVL
jgi:hypothetical protein